MAKLNVDAQGNYTVIPGDTLSSIASGEGRTLADLLSVNPQYASNPNLIHPGDVIKSSPSLSGLISNGQNTNLNAKISTPTTFMTSPVSLNGLMNQNVPTPNTPAISQVNNYPSGNSTPSSTQTYSPPTQNNYSTGTSDSTAQTADSNPIVNNTNNSAPTNTPTSSTATHTPQEVILAIMKDLQGQQQQGQAGLMAQQNQIKGTGFGLQNNVLQNTAMTPGAQTTAFNAAPGAVDQGVLSNNQQLELGNQAFSNASDLLNKSLDVYKPVSVGYGSQLVDPTNGNVINPGLFGTTGAGTSAGINPLTGLPPTAGVPQILGYLATKGVDTTRYDMPGLINAILNGATAEDIISGRAGLAGAKSAATTGSGYTMDAYGNFVQRAGGTIGGNTGGGSSNTGSTQSSAPSGYVVKSEDTYSNLAPQLGTTVQALEQANPGVNERDLQIGQRINLPSQNMSVSSSGSTFNSPKANEASLSQQQTYADTTQRAFNTAQDNLQSIITYMNDAHVNETSTIPLVNSIAKSIQLNLTSPGTAAGYQAAIQGLRSEYAQVLSRGGEVTDSARSQANALIPDNLTPAQLQQVAARLNIEGTNALKEANSQINIIGNRATGNAVSTSSSSGGNNPLGI